jgi:hypothetical protein
MPSIGKNASLTVLEPKGEGKYFLSLREGAPPSDIRSRAQKQNVQLASYDERLVAAARHLDIAEWCPAPS